MKNKCKLYPFQQRILDDAADCDRVGYFLEMGLGKTFLGTEKLKLMSAKINLVVCQKSKVSDWVEHLLKYSDYLIEDCTQWKKSDWEDFSNTVKKVKPCVLVVNYELVFRRKQFLTLKNFTLLLDESSLIQNSRAMRTKFVMKLKPTATILLSGTPTGGKYENLWTQCKLLGWNISKTLFNQHYINWKTIEVGGFPLKVVDKDNPYKNVERLKAKMRENGAVFMTSQEVFDLPEQNIIPIKVKTSKEYAHFQKHKVITINGTELIGDTILSQRLYSRMLCGQFSKAKIEAFRSLCESTSDRLIVFYNFNEELLVLKNVANDLNREVSEINGQTKDLTAYENCSDSMTFIQYKAGAMGLNLQKSNKIIYFTLTEEAELFMQSMKRIHRIGQERPCFYYILLCENSVEDKEILPTLGLREMYTNELFKEVVNDKSNFT